MNENNMHNGLFIYQDKDEPQFGEVNYEKVEQKKSTQTLQIFVYL